MGTLHSGNWLANAAKIPVTIFGIVKSVSTTMLGVLKTSSKILDSVLVKFRDVVEKVKQTRPMFRLSASLKNTQ